ncbi:MAG: flagellar motor switch protein FliN [Clostridiales Family XIII bacterium]|jgi:flagellar motor switch protein FliN/FliY|nr:flagellar motor switch protein FliN [Clostridiales Family XIII bacterium]
MTNDEQEYVAFDPFGAEPAAEPVPADYETAAAEPAPYGYEEPAPGAPPAKEPPPPADAESGMDLVRDIPLSVNVELGRARKEISEILEFGVGAVVVLDKLAGDPVEVFANGKLIARGEVVVIDENYGVRITEIVR